MLQWSNELSFSTKYGRPTSSDNYYCASVSGAFTLELISLIEKIFSRFADFAETRDCRILADSIYYITTLIIPKPKQQTYLKWAKCCQGTKDYIAVNQILKEGLRKYPDSAKILTDLVINENNFSYSLIDRISPDNSALNTEVEIIICIHNARREAEDCLGSVQDYTREPFSVTIVDDASDEETRIFIDRFCQSHRNARVLRNKLNQGYTKSANKALKATDKDWVVLLNSDTCVTPGWLDDMLKCLNTDTRIKAVGPLSNAATIQSVPLMRDKHGQFSINQLPEEWTPERMSQLIKSCSVTSCFKVPILNGFCTLYHRPTLELLGFFDETHFPYGYGEETDLCLRMVREGYRLAVTTNSYVYHNRSASFGKNRREELTRKGVECLRTKWSEYSYRYISDAVARINDLRALREEISTKMSCEALKTDIK